MNLYIVKLIFNINIESTESKQTIHQFDEQTRIIKALTLDNAFHKARSVGKKEENTFIDQNNKIVTWKFIDVIELHCIEQMQDGEQLYGQTHETENADTFIEYAKHKSMIIQTRF